MYSCNKIITNIKLNGKRSKTLSKTTEELKKELSLGKDFVILVNGKQTNENIKLYDNISVSFIKNKTLPSLKEYKEMMSARYGSKIFSQILSAKVAISGLGGIGSNTAVMLARSGVGELLLVDFDKVEPSNLNRQYYFAENLGILKTKALKTIIKNINPFIKIKTKNIFIKNKQDIIKTFSKYKIICEAFDKPHLKALITNTVLTEMPNTILVAANGMAGYYSSNKIKTVKHTEQLYICGDMENETNEHNSLFAPRVVICAAHQANMVIRIILNINKA